MQESTGLRERKKHEARHAISRAALALAVEHGPANVTVEEIAAAADVSPRTVFNYFPTKEAAILGLDPSGRKALVAHLANRPSGESPLTALQESLRASLTVDNVTAWRTRARLARANPPLHSAYLQSWAELENDLTAALAERAGLDPSIDFYPRLAVAVTVTALRVAVGNALDTGRADDISSIVGGAFTAITNGLVLPPRSHPGATGSAAPPSR